MAGHNYKILADETSQNKRRLGKAFEEKAEKYLSDRGMKILEKNYFCKFGEADIIAVEDNTLVFVEVKYRKNALKGNPLEAVNQNKMKKLCRVADFYICSHKQKECNVRFDVISILGEEIEHIINAFEYR